MKTLRKDEYLFYFILLSTFFIFFIRMLKLQIIDDSYKLKADEYSKMVINLFPDRGFIYDRKGKLLVSNKYVYDIVLDKQYVSKIDTTIFFNSLKFPKSYISERLSFAKKTNSKKIILFKDITDQEYGLLKEYIFREEGIYIEKKNIRLYSENLGANILGYVGGITTNILKNDDFYEGGSIVGVSGVEKSYEKYLRGTRGEKHFYTNSKRDKVEPYENGKYDKESIKGTDITITIDSELQKYAEKLMKGKKGSIVGIEPSTGEILILVSSPTYNPNLLTGRGKNENYYILKSEEDLPLYDRAILAQYPPGSPFKIITGLVALQQKRISQYTTHVCNYGYKLSPTKVIGCKCGTGSTPISIITAIERSCNTFFIKSYKKSLDNNKPISDSFLDWYNDVTSFGLNSYYNNDIYTGKKGFIPTPSYYNKVYGENKWYSTYTLSNAIGQGEILMTPLQIANLASTVANRGYYYIPHIGKNIEGKDINDIFKKKKYTNIDKENFDIVVRGMRRVVSYGSGRSGEVKNLEICGKTGTAQNTNGKDHSIFMSFAPMNNPKIALSVIVENSGFGATWAVPISSLIIEKYLTNNVSRKELEETIMNKTISK